MLHLSINSSKYDAEYIPSCDCTPHCDKLDNRLRHFKPHYQSIEGLLLDSINVSICDGDGDAVVDGEGVGPLKR
jgi:hypothetical protein